jgi:hypothetical protein
MALTTNKNYMQPTQFNITISRKNYPNISFFAQGVEHPGMASAAVTVPYSRTDAYLPGDKIEFGTLGVTALIDEDMVSYKEIYDWMLSNVEGFTAATDATDTKPASTADITVNVLNSMNNKTKEIRYYNAFPTDISGIAFASTTEEQFLTFNITFQFDQFELI